MNKKVKGQFGYLSSQTKREIIKTIIYFAVSISLYIAGYVKTGSNKNLLTIVAILGCLPASKSAVSMIMFLRSKGCTVEVYDKIKAYEEGLLLLYDLFLTSYKKNYRLVSVVVHAGNICAYSDDSACDTTEATKHIQHILFENGHKEVGIKIIKELPVFLERLSSLKKLEGIEEDETLAALLLAISL